jgi:hypothetical protein
MVALWHFRSRVDIFSFLAQEEDVIKFGTIVTVTYLDGHEFLISQE